ncbi:MAG: alpha/beta hydrolase, partial [Moorea sp. SIO2I5]|nr:alpha/beta hydrolase [Moorena sp. SIO2I5]
MFPDFLPSNTQQLVESTSIVLAQSIQRQAISTPLSPQAIATTYVNQGKGGTPILLLHGF